MAAGKRLPQGNDPRLHLDADELEAANTQAMPQVTKGSTAGDSLGLVVGIIGVLALGLITWFGLSKPTPVPQAPPPVVAQVAPAQPSVLPPIQPDLNPQPEEPQQSLLVQPQIMAQPQPQPVVTPPSTAPALIVDNSVPTAQAQAQAQAAAAAAKPPSNANDQFLASQTADVSQRAWNIGDPSKVVPQGAVIPAVLETAINSDLPGYTRAIVSRDIRSFDGTTILVPRGSRLIGQYKSGLTSGETRAFIIWNRLIRPDGLSVQLASPATDDLGQAGMTGRVDTHFAKRFGSATLLTVINGLSSVIGKSSGSTIVIGSSGDAKGMIGEALANDIKIPPTIKVAQGAPILVFAARDLNFNTGN